MTYPFILSEVFFVIRKHGNPNVSIPRFLLNIAVYWGIYMIVWNIIMPDEHSLWQPLGNSIVFALSIITATSKLYFKQKYYIKNLEQDVWRFANDIELTREHLAGLKRNMLTYQESAPPALISQIHRYEDQLTQAKIDYNQAVKDYNLGITIMPYALIKRPKELDYFSDFFI